MFLMVSILIVLYVYYGGPGMDLCFKLSYLGLVVLSVVWGIFLNFKKILVFIFTNIIPQAKIVLSFSHCMSDLILSNTSLNWPFIFFISISQGFFWWFSLDLSFNLVSLSSTVFILFISSFKYFNF